jgi:hypothetical protein
MKKSSRTALSFKEDQMETINSLKKALAGQGQKDLSSREIFLLAMSYGYSCSNVVTGWKRTNNGPRLEYMQPKDETLLAALAVADSGNPSALKDIEWIYDRAEDYAAGGFALLGVALKSERDFHAWIEGEVFSSFQAAANEMNQSDA